MTDISALLEADELPAYDILNAGGDPRIILTCEHAGDVVPRKLNLLGMIPDDYKCHYAVDIGVRDVTRYLSGMLNAPAILGNYSRLVVDLNRAVDHPTTFAPVGEGKPVPGNIDISDADKARRIREIYEPYHQTLTGIIDRVISTGIIPVIISVHSYTPKFFAFARPWEIGFLHSDDSRLSDALIGYFRRLGYTVGDNEPYDHRIVRGSSINRHAGLRRLPHTMVEFRNNMISNDKDAFFWAKLFADGLQEVLEDTAMRTYYEGLQLPYDPEKERTYFADLVERAKKGEP